METRRLRVLRLKCSHTARESDPPSFPQVISSSSPKSKEKNSTITVYEVNCPPEEKFRIYTQCRRDVIFLRVMGVYALDRGPHNVLYCPETKDVTMVDFELTEVTETGKQQRGNRLELSALFHNNVYEL